MTATLLALPAPLCSICGDGADEVSPSPAYFAHGDFWGCESICVDCAAFAVWDGIEDFAAFRWWTPAAAQRFAQQAKSMAEADARDAATVRESCPCGEIRDDFGACWKCDGIHLVPLEGSREAERRAKGVR